jgi:hypothetical protein
MALSRRTTTSSYMVRQVKLAIYQFSQRIQYVINITIRDVRVWFSYTEWNISNEFHDGTRPPEISCEKDYWIGTIGACQVESGRYEFQCRCIDFRHTFLSMDHTPQPPASPARMDPHPEPGRASGRNQTTAGRRPARGKSHPSTGNNINERKAVKKFRCHHCPLRASICRHRLLFPYRDTWYTQNPLARARDNGDTELVAS